MKVHSHIAMGLTAGAFLLIGSLAVAQSPSTGSAASKAPAATTTQPRDAASGQATGRRQDQFGHASGLAVSPQSGSAKGIQEKGLLSTPSGPEQPNKMAIKENGLPGPKPKPKPKP